MKGNGICAQLEGAPLRAQKYIECNKEMQEGMAIHVDRCGMCANSLLNYNIFAEGRKVLILEN